MYDPQERLAPAREPKSDSIVFASLNDPLEGPSYGPMVRLMSRYSVPVVMTCILDFLVPVATQIALGHVDAEAMAAGSLGTILFNFTCLSVVMGLFSAQDTLCTQAFGSGDFALVGIVTQRSILIALASCLPLAVLWIGAKQILLLLGQEEVTSTMAARFVHLQIGTVPFIIVFEALKRFLSCQGIFVPTLLCTIPVVLIHPIILYILVFHWGYGFVGGAVANAISYVLLCVLLLGFVLVFRPHHPSTWCGWSVAQAVRNWAQFLTLGLPGAAMMCLEWWSFECLTLIAGLNGTIDLAAMNIIEQLIVLLYMVTYGLALAAQTIVGNYVGARKPRVAVKAIKVAFVMCLVSCGVATILVASLRDRLVRLFTDNEQVVQATSPVLLVVSINLIVDGLHGIAEGVFKGVGLQRIGAWLMFVLCYLVELPLAYLLGVHLQLGLKGIILSYTVNYALMSLVEWSVIVMIKWDKLSAITENESTLAIMMHEMPDAGCDPATASTHHNTPSAIYAPVNP